MDTPSGFRYISEDRRTAMLERRAEERGLERRSQIPCSQRLLLVPREQEVTAETLRVQGMVVR